MFGGRVFDDACRVWSWDLQDVDAINGVDQCSAQYRIFVKQRGSREELRVRGDVGLRQRPDALLTDVHGNCRVTHVHGPSEPDRQIGHRPPGTDRSSDLLEQAVRARVDAYFDRLVASRGLKIGRSIGGVAMRTSRVSIGTGEEMAAFRASLERILKSDVGRLS